jgi:hypothetical protein
MPDLTRLSGLQLRSSADGRLDLRAHVLEDGDVLIAYWIRSDGLGDWKRDTAFVLRRGEVAKLGYLIGKVPRRAA